MARGVKHSFTKDDSDVGFCGEAYCRGNCGSVKYTCTCGGYSYTGDKDVLWEIKHVLKAEGLYA